MFGNVEGKLNGFHVNVYTGNQRKSNLLLNSFRACADSKFKITFLYLRLLTYLHTPISTSNFVLRDNNPQLSNLLNKQSY